MANDTGTSNPTYNLVSVLYHALQGAENYERYASEAGSDQDLANFSSGKSKSRRSRERIAPSSSRRREFSRVADQTLQQAEDRGSVIKPKVR
jgi:hypothetical protein